MMASSRCQSRGGVPVGGLDTPRRDDVVRTPLPTVISATTWTQGYIMGSSRYIMDSSMLAVPHLPHGYAWYLVVPPSSLRASWDRDWSTHQNEASFLCLSSLLQDGANDISIER